MQVHPFAGATGWTVHKRAALPLALGSTYAFGPVLLSFVFARSAPAGRCELLKPKPGREKQGREET